MTLVLKSDATRGQAWTTLLAEKAPELPFRVWPDVEDPSNVRYLAAWIPPDDVMKVFPGLQVLFSVGAGVDQLDLSRFPLDLPIVRMVEPGLVESMVEYVTMAVLMLHRDAVCYMARQREQRWQPEKIVAAQERSVGVLGLGMLGEACSRRLADFGFKVAGWSRSRRTLDGIDCFAGDAELEAFLGRTDILVCLLPLTDQTRGILDADLFRKLPRGAMLVNAGRGGHLDQGALLDALDTGQLSAAVLDVAVPEPLPAGHRLWSHPRIFLTPHIASRSRDEAAVDLVIENIERLKAGRPMIGLVDRTRGY